MVQDTPHFDIPLNLPHAGRVAGRILAFLDQENSDQPETQKTAEQLVRVLLPYFQSDENPGPEQAARVRDLAADLGRRLVDHIEQNRLGHDRLGQCVRNLFECLGLGREGALISLRAGEDPRSFQRPI